MSEIAKYYCPYCKHKYDISNYCDSCREIINCSFANGDLKSMSNYEPDENILSKITSGTESTDDPVNHPNHYQTKSGLETIQVIEAFTDGLEGIEAVCTANVIKYICRWKKKNGLQDLKKAQWYLNKLIKHVEESVDEAKQVKTEAVKINREVTLRKLKDACDLVFEAWERWPDELMNYHGNITDFLKEKQKAEKEKNNE